LPSDLATERLELRLTKAQTVAWAKLAKAQGLTLKALVVAAVEAYEHRGDEGALADLGRQVLALVEQRLRALGYAGVAQRISCGGGLDRVTIETPRPCSRSPRKVD
jgi:hypothetical protein